MHIFQKLPLTMNDILAECQYNFCEQRGGDASGMHETAQAGIDQWLLFVILHCRLTLLRNISFFAVKELAG